MGLLEAATAGIFGELLQGISLFQSVFEVVIAGAFVYFILTRYWWKTKPAAETKK
jgi:hypothetical protein